MPAPNFLISPNTPDWRFEEIAQQISHLAASTHPTTSVYYIAGILIKENSPRRIERIRETLEQSIADFLHASLIHFDWHVSLEKHLEHKCTCPNNSKSKPIIIYSFLVIITPNDL